MLQFAVVEQSNKGLVAVPTKWVNEREKFYWYPKPSKNTSSVRLVMMMKDPMPDWDKHQYDTFKTYSKFFLFHINLS